MKEVEGKLSEEQTVKITDAIKALEETISGTDKEAITSKLSELFVASNAINEVKQQSATEEPTTPKSDDNVVDAEFTETKDKN